jgi:D-glycero-alpha-D-manno-heptose-7-phosphate kinase
VRSEAPPASGLGSSAALGVAAIGALSRYHGRHLLAQEVARESQLLEVEELKLESGVQDQLASAYGGVSFMEVEYPNARVLPVPLSPAVRCELEDRFVLVYTGRSHFSSAMHQKVINEADRHRGNFDDLARAAVLGKEALLRGDLDDFAAAMNANWAAQKGLHPDITTPGSRRCTARPSPPARWASRPTAPAAAGQSRSWRGRTRRTWSGGPSSSWG